VLRAPRALALPRSRVTLALSSLILAQVVASVIAGVIIAWTGILLAQSGFNTWSQNTSLREFSQGIFFAAFGIATVIMEIFYPPSCTAWFGFYTRWLGKGIWFGFLGALIFCPNCPTSVNACWLCFFGGLFILILAGLYLIFFFLPGVPSPTPVSSTYGSSGFGSSASSSSEPRTRVVKTTTTTTHSSSSGSKAATNKCPQCGAKKTSSGDVFCGDCGYRF